jgi:hypothetical protein
MGSSPAFFYSDLYARWEDGNWSATAIDFAADRPDWAGLSELQERSMRWQFAMFFNGEDVVTDNLSPTSTPPHGRAVVADPDVERFEGLPLDIERGASRTLSGVAHDEWRLTNQLLEAYAPRVRSAPSPPDDLLELVAWAEETRNAMGALESLAAIFAIRRDLPR